jgi:putative peptide zinc metalloprotease protein
MPLSAPAGAQLAAPPRDAVGPTDALPRLADGIELLGEYKGSGRLEPLYLIRRGDGRMLEVSSLLHTVAAALDGARGVADVATVVSAESGREISAHNLAYVIDHKLRPLRVVADAAAPPTPATATRPLLALGLRAAVIPKGAVRDVTTVLLPLFLPAVVVAVLGAFAGFDIWLALSHGIADGVNDVLWHPTLLLMALGLTILAGGFHELGHATASRYGGAEPGVIGAGIYLLWPAFFNDLNDSYRLDRRGRLRADLGGVYFNVVFILALAAAYGLTGFRPLLVVIVVQHLAILQQFLPFLRFDGYYLVSDVAGVPDLFGRIRPILTSLVPGHDAPAAVSELTPRARAVVTAWVLITVPLLAASLVLLVVHLPRFGATVWQSLGLQARALAAAGRAGVVVPALLSGAQLVLLAIPLIGLAVIVLRVLLLGWRSSVGDHPGSLADTRRNRRLLGGAVALNLGLALAAVTGVLPAAAGAARLG